MTDATQPPRVRRRVVRPVPVWAWIPIGLLAAGVLGLGAFLATGALANVPSVVGLTADEAVRTLDSAGFARGAVTRAETSTPAGQVLSQSPLPGVLGRRGDAIALVVAAPRTAQVPPLTGMDAAGARSAAAAVGLTLSPHDSYDASAPIGTVFVQATAAGVKVARGAVVAVFVSRGPVPHATRVPDVTSRTSTAAVALLTKAGFEPVLHDGVSTSVASGTAIAQLPKRGTPAAPGSPVHILVSTGAATPTAEVPGVTGRKSTDAIATLTSAGLAALVERAPSATVPTGAVIAQLPAAGSAAPRGGEVVIVISSGAVTAGVVAPAVTGRTSVAAQVGLEALGLVLESVPSVSLDVPAGSVIAQLPPPGASVKPGATVVCVVSTGRP